MVVVVVEPNLSPGNYLGMPRQLLQGLIRGVIGEPRFVGMNSDRRIHKRIFLCQLNPGIEIRRTIAIANGDHRPHSGLTRASDYLVAIGVELLAIEMCVRIDEHGTSAVGLQTSDLGPQTSDIKT